MTNVLSISARSELREQVALALLSHHEWVNRLESAIASGESTYDIDEVAAPDRCRIGIWLVNDISEELQATPLYKVTRGRHATFHREAATVLRAALADEVTLARAMMADDGSFGRAAFAIREALDAWLQLAEREPA